MSEQPADRRCVSAEFVFDDGTVDRAEGGEAERAHQVLDGEHQVLDGEHLELGALPIFTTTHPLRMVSWTPCGRYFDGDDVSPQGVEDDEGQVEPFRKMVPAECVLRRGIGVGPGRGVPLLRGAEGYYRVVVEFVPKDGGKR